MINETMNSQPKVRLSKVLLMLCLSAAIVMGTMPCKPFVMEVKADTPAEKTITGLGLGTIMTKPNEPKERYESWMGSRVYFGKYAGNPMKYRVLACSENMILLDCDNILKDIQFSTWENNNNSWKESKVRSWLQGNDFYNNTDVFTAAEKNAIHAGNEEIEGIDDVTIPEDYTIVDLEDPDPVFVLNVSAVINSRLGYYNDTNWSNTRQKVLLDAIASKCEDWWWLRSKGRDQIDTYDSVGTVYGTKVRALSVIDGYVGVSPALYLKTAPILYSSLVNGSEGQAGSEYKLTVKDEGLSVSYNNVEGEDESISVSYTFEDNSASADPTQISVVVTDKEWDSETKLNEINVIQYTKLAMDSFGSSGTGTFTLDSNPTGTWGKDYHVYILAEDVNGTCETDYASEPVELKPSVWASAEDQEFTYDGNPHGISVNVNYPKNGVTVKYGESADNCTLNTSPTITNVSESPKTIYYKAEANGLDPATGSATVTINKAESAITKAPSAKTGLKYTGKAQALIDAGTVTGGTMYYAVTTGTAAPDGSAYTETVPQKTDAGTYYVWYKVTGDGNHKDIAPDSVSVTIKQAESAITKAPSAISGLKYTGEEQALVNAGTATGGTLYYAVTTENTAPAGSAYTAAVPKKTDAGTYYIWYKVNGGGNYEDIDPDSVSVTIKQAESAITKAPSAKTGLKYTGEAQALVNAGTATGGAMYYAVTTENKAPAGTAYTAAVPQKTDAGTYYVWYKVTGGGNYEDIDPDSVSVTIKQAESAITKAPSAISDLKYTGETQALVNAGTATGGTLYYAVTTGTAAPAGSAYTAAVPKKTDAGTYYVWYKVNGGGNYEDIDPDSVSVTIDKADSVITKAPSAISGLKYTGRAQALVNAGTVTGGTMYYAVTTENTAPDGSAYTAAVPQKTDVGTYYVWYKVMGDGNHTDTAASSVSVTIDKADSVITKAPSAISGLKYTGQAQALVNAGTATGGTLYYAVTTENTAPVGSAYTAAVPQKTDVGTYYVWYKVMGDGNHTDTAASSVSVTIAGEDKPDEPEREAHKPVLIKATSDAISVKAEEGVEYSVDGGNNWNTTGIFNDLQQDTEYSIIARYAASGEKAAGEPSEALRVRTLKIVEKPVSTKTLKVSDNEISIDTVLLSEEGNNEEAYSVGQVEIPDDVAVSLFNSLSKEEQQRVAEGEKFTISISVKESIIDMENKELKDNKEKADKEIKEKTGGTVEATGMMLDIGLLVQVGDSEKKKTEPTQGSGKITFTVTVPVEMKNTDSSITRTYYLIHILDDGTVEIVNSGTGTEIPAETDSFSYWYLTYVDEKKESGKEEEEEKKDDNTGNNGNTSTEKVITVSDNQPMAYSEETKGDFRIGYCHEIPFFGKAKPELKLFGDIKVIYDGKEYKATKIKVNKKKGLIRITGLNNADKDIVKAVKTATKGSNGLSFKVNPYYVKDTDTVTPKFKKDGSLKSVKVRIQGKDYKVKKGEFSYDKTSKTVSFSGSNLNGSRKLN